MALACLEKTCTMVKVASSTRKLGAWLVMALACVIIVVGCSNDIGVVKEPIEVFNKDCRPKAPKCDSEIIAVLQPGEEFEIFGEVAHKDGVLLEVGLGDGRVGYLWLSPKFQIIRKNSGGSAKP